MRPVNIKKSTIANNALRLLYDLGYNECTMRKIAEASAISHASIYKHFERKNELATLFVHRFIDMLLLITKQFMKEENTKGSEGSQILIFWVTQIYSLIYDDKLFRFYQEFFYSDIKSFISAYVDYEIYIDVVLKTPSHGPQILEKINTQLIGVGLIELCILCRKGDLDFSQCVVNVMRLFCKIRNFPYNFTDSDITEFCSEYLNSNKFEKINVEKDIVEKGDEEVD